jgi:two-component system, chemotaxis family, sensor kinase CheA
MDLRRFLDLYISEAQEHVRLLHRSLLALESDASAGAAIDEAFRAAHTLKGLSAAMGFTAVADMAHILEDRLAGLRDGRIQPDSALVDIMLSQADELEGAIAIAVTGPIGAEAVELATPDSPGAARPTARHTTSSAIYPAGTTVVCMVRLRPDAPIKSARAMLIMRALQDRPGVLGSDPATFDDDDFSGDFRIFLTGAADATEVEASIMRAGDVESVDFLEPARAAQAPAAAAVASSAPPARQLRVDAARLDAIADGIAELSVLYGRMPSQGLPHHVESMIDRLGVVLASLQLDVLALQMVPVSEAFERLPRVVRDAARQAGKEVELIIEGDDVELDRAILEEIGEPLVHLLRNAVDHGIESSERRAAAGKPARGRVRLSAERERSSVRIVLQDDGAGVNAGRVIEKARASGLLPADSPDTISAEELFRLLSHAGFSTASEVTALSGRGVGMDVVVSRIRALGGAIEMHTTPGAGTTFSIRLPITLALAQALRVRIAGEDYAIPLTHVSEAVLLDGRMAAGERETVVLRDERIPLVRMRRMLRAADAGEEQAAVIAEIGDRRAALAVDELVGREHILVKSFDPVAGMLPFFSGVTLLADGRPALVLDPLSVI